MSELATDARVDSVDVTTNVSDEVEAPSKKDTVAYDTYRRTVAAEKKAKEALYIANEKLKAYEEQKSTEEQERLKQNDEFKKLYEMKDQEASTFRKELETFKMQRQQSRKLDSFLKCVDAPVDEKYWGLVDLDNIIIDQATNEVDEMSITKAVETFRKQYPEVIGLKETPKLPTQAPQGLQDVDLNKMSLAERRKHIAERMIQNGMK